MLQLEGYQYDVTADFLTAQVVRTCASEAQAERANLEIPISFSLRRLIHATMALISHAIRTPLVDETDSREPADDPRNGETKAE